MRSATKTLLAVLVAGGMVACDTGEDIDTFETETTPATEPATVEERSAVLTADIDPVDEAEDYREIDGEVRIYEAMAGATGATPRADDPAATETDLDAPTDDAALDRPATGQRAFELEIEVTGLQQGAEHAWNIRRGTCDDETAGEAAVNFSGTDDALAQALRPSADGRVMTTATVPANQLSLDQLEEEDYSLHILEGSEADGIAIACADLNTGLGVF